MRDDHDFFAPTRARNRTAESDLGSNIPAFPLIETEPNITPETWATDSRIAPDNQSLSIADESEAPVAAVATLECAGAAVVAAADRPLATCIFANEKETTPTKTENASWEQIVKLHDKRNIRPGKSGRMLGGYAINGTRSNANVPFRSVIQLDIDTEVVKDKAAGRILEVTKAAPTLEEIRSGIDEYEWCAASSHSHEPQRGVVKYRVVMLPDRDIQPEEHEPILEALDELLQGALDRNAWQWSQAFYLPSCPAANEPDAFFVRNHGAPLPVDEFVRRGREILGTHKHKNLSLGLGTIIPPKHPPMPEMPETSPESNSMLQAIDPNVGRKEWRQICWAVMATGWTCVETLIREWSEGGHKFEEKDFTNVVRDFDPNKGTGFGTLDFHARRHGWAGAVPAVEEGVTIDQFRAYMPMHNYIFLPSREPWPASSVNSRIPPIPLVDKNGEPILDGNSKQKTQIASVWLDKNRPVEQMTWAPGEPMLIIDRLVANGGWIGHGGATCFNLYRPPVPQSGGDVNEAGPWLDHICKVFPNEAKHIVRWCAHRVQRPQEKINHALVLGGDQGIRQGHHTRACEASDWPMEF